MKSSREAEKLKHLHLFFKLYSTNFWEAVKGSMSKFSIIKQPSDFMSPICNNNNNKKHSIVENKVNFGN